MKPNKWITALAAALLAVTFWPALPAAGQDEADCAPDSGTVITRQITSAALGQVKSYSVYAPPDWCHLDDLPLLVMLHGYTGDNTDWVKAGNIDQAADALILAGEITPLVILMPDGDNSFYVDGTYGNYETYVIDELVSAVDEAFPTAATRETRFIGGLSMGGYGALYLGLRHPDMFSAIGAHSPALLQPGEQAPPWLYGPTWDLFEERDVISMIQRDGWPEQMRLFVDVGNGDRFLRDVYLLAGALLTTSVPDFQAHVWPGVHDWDYWSAHAPDYLLFYAGVVSAES